MRHYLETIANLINPSRPEQDYRMVSRGMTVIRNLIGECGA